MKWFKHMSDAIEDPFIGSLLDEFGGAGYFMYFGLIEICAKQWKAGTEPKFILPVKWLSAKLRTKPKILLRFLEYSDNQTKTKSFVNGNILTICIPNMLKIKDEYSKKSRHTRDLLPAKSIRVQSKESPLNPPKGKRGTRISDDFQLNDELRKIATDLGLNGKTDFIFAKFRTYWESVSGQRAVKINWKATWKNWCLTESERQGTNQQLLEANPYRTGQEADWKKGDPNAF